MHGRYAIDGNLDHEKGKSRFAGGANGNSQFTVQLYKPALIKEVVIFPRWSNRHQNHAYQRSLSVTAGGQQGVTLASFTESYVTSHRMKGLRFIFNDPPKATEILVENGGNTLGINEIKVFGSSLGDGTSECSHYNGCPSKYDRKLDLYSAEFSDGAYSDNDHDDEGVAERAIDGLKKLRNMPIPKLINLLFVSRLLLIPALEKY